MSDQRIGLQQQDKLKYPSGSSAADALVEDAPHAKC